MNNFTTDASKYELFVRHINWCKTCADRTCKIASDDDISRELARTRTISDTLEVLFEREAYCNDGLKLYADSLVEI